MTRTFVDSGVLIAASRGSDLVSLRALAVITDPARIFASSDFIKLEVLPKPTFTQRHDQVRMLEGFFARVTIWASDHLAIVREALEIAPRYGLGPLDALHLAAARLAAVDEIVTTEQRSKNFHHVPGLRISTLSTAADRA